MYLLSRREVSARQDTMTYLVGEKVAKWMVEVKSKKC